MGFFEKLGRGLKKTRDSIFGSISQMFDAGEVTDALYEDLEEQLILADTGADVAEELVERLKTEVGDNRLKTGVEVQQALKGIITEMLTPDAPFELDGHPTVILVIGVNGVGKTTSIAKLAHLYTGQGKTVMLAAGDTFRAAAVEQLDIWAQRAGVPMVRHQDGADAAAVVFDAVQSATAKGLDVVIADTAGRLHNKKNLMGELSKITRVVHKANPDAKVETLLVLDSVTGQNAISQAREFIEAAGATGIILTKLDGTAKGGAVISIKAKLGLPVRYVGVGEGIDDLMEFDPAAFADALFLTDGGPAGEGSDMGDTDSEPVED
ncbi:MAG: signal recognition particle-docking protein FtsY [Ruminococcaceae bacterium]|nr:signal recognition particle-docking protein FtsY [Oscillospiraceae bacterium]